mmetsp:Transcript_44619/g.111003  ORF Transcript_44619/g.111003 Transcript_44619/m.111003 type:complete len:399 (-) Transcript_44619:1265-2461(-)
MGVTGTGAACGGGAREPRERTRARVSREAAATPREGRGHRRWHPRRAAVFFWGLLAALVFFFCFWTRARLVCCCVGVRCVDPGRGCGGGGPCAAPSGRRRTAWLGFLAGVELLARFACAGIPLSLSLARSLSRAPSPRPVALWPRSHPPLARCTRRALRSRAGPASPPGAPRAAYCAISTPSAACWCTCSTLMASLILALSASGDSSKLRSSPLSISKSMPVILPARMGSSEWMSGNRRSPRICFCCSGGAAASEAGVIGSDGTGGCMGACIACCWSAAICAAAPGGRPPCMRIADCCCACAAEAAACCACMLRSCWFARCCCALGMRPPCCPPAMRACPCCCRPPGPVGIRAAICIAPYCASCCGYMPGRGCIISCCGMPYIGSAGCWPRMPGTCCG